MRSIRHATTSLATTATASLRTAGIVSLALAAVALLAASAAPLLAAAAPALAVESAPAGRPQQGLPAGFEVLGSMPVGRAPHGIRFSADGTTAYIALSGDDQIAVVDLEHLVVKERITAGQTPLDLIALKSGGWAVTQFRADRLITIGTPEAAEWPVGKGPSLFAPTSVGGLAVLVSEFADRLTLFDTHNGTIAAIYPTGNRPYPADVTPDGVLAFVPNRDAGSVSVIDLLNRTPVTETPVCEHPEGGALTRDGVSYVVACGGSDELVFVNTASFAVTARVNGVGPRPFSVAMSADGRFGLVNDAGGATISVLDVSERRILGQIPVGEQPIVVRMHPDGRRAVVSSEVSGTLTVIGLPAAPTQASGDAPTEVVVFGMIHGAHRTSERYGTDVLREAIRAVAPDQVLVEIPPNRFEQAQSEFSDSGSIAEPRVVRFPEYVDVLFPLTREMDFEIVPTAGWNQHMSDYRNSTLDRIGHDPERADEWREYETATALSDETMNAGGEPDDPLWIHTDAYDAAQEIALSVYNRLFNDEIGPGGWDHINTAHYANIADALDRIRGQGKRVLITYGAGHKGWFLRRLRERDDVELLDAREFFGKGQAP